MSGVSTASPRITCECASIRFERRLPPCGRGSIVPFVRTCCQRIALDALTPNRSAAWRHDMPWAVASTTRRRRSVESCMLASFTNMQLESDSTNLGNPQ